MSSLINKHWNKTFCRGFTNKVDEARIKAMDEGSAKTIAEMEFNFEKEMQAIDRQKRMLCERRLRTPVLHGKLIPKTKEIFDATGIELSDSETKYFDELYKAAIANNEKTYSELANQYLSYTDERLAIERSSTMILLYCRKPVGKRKQKAMLMG